jgi:hypothetical protein
MSFWASSSLPLSTCRNEAKRPAADRLAREFQGDEMMEQYFVKYGLQSIVNEAL